MSDTKEKKTSYKSEEVNVLLYGSLEVINWDKGTALLYRYEEQPVNLSFDASLNEQMKYLAMSEVKVKGLSRLNHDDTWGTVTIKEINRTSPTDGIPRSFDLEGFKNDPPPKIFDPENIVTMSEPFDTEEFIRTIYEGR